MRDELNKKIRELCEDAGSQAALRMIPVLTADLDREYDKRIEAGMVELDAYRDVLRSVDRIEAMLRSLPKDSRPSSAACRLPGPTSTPARRAAASASAAGPAANRCSSAA